MTVVSLGQKINGCNILSSKKSSHFSICAIVVLNSIQLNEFRPFYLFSRFLCKNYFRKARNMATRLDGKIIAGEIRAELKDRVNFIRQRFFSVGLSS